MNKLKNFFKYAENCIMADQTDSINEYTRLRAYLTLNESRFWKKALEDESSKIRQIAGNRLNIIRISA